MNDEKDVKIETVSLDDVAENGNAEKASDAVAQDVEKLAMQLAELNDKYLRMAAELENTRRRAALDAESRARNRAMAVAEKILPVMDAVDAAMKISPDDEGIKTMARALESAFEQIGITKIKSVGETLNPMHHNAIQVVERPNLKSGTIAEEMQAGYMFGDTVMRTAMVIVGK
ncbi:MAG: nucleotide exchange factor GrpE [Alphaproteobacteria bacterium]|nr:nucleotide exchange factor GrpE [Alphaproteobacteria bacterium]